MLNKALNRVLIKNCAKKILLTTSVSLLSITSLPLLVSAADITLVSQSAKVQLMEKLQKIEYFSANFSQKVFDTESVLLQAGQGTIVVSKPNKVHWKTEQPEESLIVSNGETLWLFDPFIEQASAFSLADSVANTPILLLTNQSEAIWSKYSITATEDSVYTIISNDQQSQVTSLIIQFKDNKILSLVINDATGQKSEITLSASNYTSKPDENLFDFIVPEGIYLDDQR
jgi:outer membrane lipoprotein carrier protein